MQGFPAPFPALAASLRSAAWENTKGIIARPKMPCYPSLKGTRFASAIISHISPIKLLYKL